MLTPLVQSLDLFERDHVAVVGAGGKTTLVFELARELHSAGSGVIIGTTTKVWEREAHQCPHVILCPSSRACRDRISNELETHGHVFVGQRALPSGKVQGIDPAFADTLYAEVAPDYQILEADGSAGRPLKAPSLHEPVIPSTTTVVIAVMGLEALNAPLGPEVVFRAERFAQLTGAAPGMRLGPGLVSRIFQGENGLFRGAPPSARRIAFLNKVDLNTTNGEAAENLKQLKEFLSPRVDRVIVGSLKGRQYDIGRI